MGAVAAKARVAVAACAEAKALLAVRGVVPKARASAAAQKGQTYDL
jgi:hypothetical protein